MNHSLSLRALLALMFLGNISSTVLAEDPDFTAEQLEFFENSVRPILVARCQKCHGAEKQEGSLRLDFHSAVLQGGDTGPAIDLENPQASELLLAISYDPDGYQMPPDGKLPEKEIAILTKWVHDGAAWPVNEHDAPSVASEFNLEDRANHWSFRPLEPVTPPNVENQTWCSSPIDQFVLSKLEQANLSPAEIADKRMWIRRAYLDVIGLPPTPAQVEAFLADQSELAWERVADELLASPHFGERWGRHWLDLVRYAESRGHEFDYDIANAWHYRDYVIRALNADVPYDQFVVEHIAGDLLPAADSSERFRKRLHPETGGNESILGTGFWYLGEWVHSPVDIRQEEADRFANMIDVYSKTFLGLTVACARCHDHKFDPITQKDFYGLQGFLQSTTYRQARFESMEHNARVARKLEAVRREAAPVLRSAVRELTLPVFKRFDEYLLTARQLIREGLIVDSTNPVSSDISELAHERKLSPDVLQAICVRVLDDDTNMTGPARWWRAVCRDDQAALKQLIAESSSTRVDDNLASDGQPMAIVSCDGIGYRQVSGLDIELSGQASFPFADVRLGESIIRDPIWNSLSLAPQNDRDPGAMEGWERDGRILRTESFEVTDQPIHVLIRGGCRLYAAVDSHVLIRGPLHGSLVSQHEPNPEWHWITIQLAPYAGHRAHLEFVPHGEQFELAQCLIGGSDESLKRISSQHAIPTAIIDHHLHQRLEGRERPQIEDVAKAIRDLYVRALKEIGPEDLTDAILFDCIQHPAACGLRTPQAEQSLQVATAELVQRRLDLIDEIQTVSASAPCMLEGSGEDEYVFIRGGWKKHGETAPRGFLEVFAGTQQIPSSFPDTADRPVGMEVPALPGSGRLELAKQMVDPQVTPIVPRVIVNRIWQHYFGRGICRTPDDLGHLGELPSHPELLDWLASELVDRDWSLKSIHREILLSSAYRMSSQHPEASETQIRDHFAAMPIKRLEGEIIRDAMLAVTGQLNPQFHGKSVPVHLTPFMEGRGRPGQSGPVNGDRRRSLYIAVRRNFQDPLFQAFDFPNPHSTIGRRTVSNVPAQSLALLNHPLTRELADNWAASLFEQNPIDTSPDALTERIQTIYLAAFSRPPLEHEIAASLEFLSDHAADLGVSFNDLRLWSDYCQTIFCTKEFIFVR